MTIAIAKRLGQALNIKSGTRIKTIDECMRAYGRAVGQGPTVPLTGSFDASQVISGTFGDARISQSSVTQHEAALNIDWLQLTGVPATFPPSAHNHNASDINAGSMADARIQQSNVTQHQAALALAATQLTSGVLADARVQQSNVTQHQAALALAATQLTSGVLADARVQQSNVTQHEAALNIDWLQLTSVPSSFTPSAHLDGGTWTPTDASGAGLALTVYSANWVRHEDFVFVRAMIQYPVTADTNAAVLDGLPYTVQANQAARQGMVTYSDAAISLYVMPLLNNTLVHFFVNPGGAQPTNAQLSNKYLYFMVIYTLQ